ncbi:MAG: hypothetical protein ABIM99_03790 [Candidatus Dojkabacteria bacterium]
MNYRNLALFVVALVLTAGAVGIGIAYMNANQKAAVNTTTTNNTTTTTPPAAVAPTITESTDILVGFDTDTTTLALNDSMDINVKLDSSGSALQTLALALKFDPAVIRVNSIGGTGAFDIYIGDKVDTAKGYAEISGAATGGKTVANDPQFARVNISRISAGETKLTVASPATGNEVKHPFTQAVLSADLSYSVPEKSLVIN